MGKNTILKNFLNGYRKTSPRKNNHVDLRRFTMPLRIFFTITIYCRCKKKKCLAARKRKRRDDEKKSQPRNWRIFSRGPLEPPHVNKALFINFFKQIVMNYEYYDYKMASDWLYFAETRDNNCYSFVKSKIYWFF